MPRSRELHEPVQQSVHVDCPLEDAFRLFTEAFGEWWPLHLHSKSDDEAETCGMEPWIGGRIFERTRSGEERVWGFITQWEPPGHLRFTWDVRGADEGSQTIDVRFNVDADGTRVTLIHSGWEMTGVAVNALQMAA